MADVSLLGVWLHLLLLSLQLLLWVVRRMLHLLLVLLLLVRQLHVASMWLHGTSSTHPSSAATLSMRGVLATMAGALVLCPMTTVRPRSVVAHAWAHVGVHAGPHAARCHAWTRHALAHARTGAPHVALGMVRARPTVHVLALSMVCMVHAVLHGPLPSNVLIAGLLHLVHVVVILSTAH